MWYSNTVHEKIAVKNFIRNDFCNKMKFFQQIWGIQISNFASKVHSKNNPHVSRVNKIDLCLCLARVNSSYEYNEIIDSICEIC